MAGQDCGPQRQQHFPFLKLPPEIRLRVYQFAVEDLIATITALRPTVTPISDEDIHDFASNPYTSAVKYWKEYRQSTPRNCLGNGTAVRYKGAPLLGPLALLHTDSRIRAESVDTMLPLVDTRHKAAKVLIEDFKTELTIVTCAQILGVRTLEDCTQLSRQQCTAQNHEWKIGRVHEALDRAAGSLRR